MSGVRMDSRIAERRAEVRHERMHRRRRRALVALAVAALVAVAVVVERSPLVALSAVEVDGTHRTAPEDVLAAADLPLGTSTLRLRLGAAAERVEQLAAVRSATVRRVDPLTVRIEVAERRPVIAVRRDGEVALVDRDGVVVARGEPGRFPTIELLDGAVPSPGRRIEVDPAAANAFAVHRALPGPLRAEIERYVARGPDALELVLERGTRARIGRAERVAEKARVLGALLDDLPAAPGWVVDVRAPSNPVVVPPEEG